MTGTSAERSTAAEPRSNRWLRGHVPGEPGVWLFILADMTVFAIFFGVFLVARLRDPLTFAASRPSLVVGLGLVNTIMLLTSSLLVALALRRMRAGGRTSSARLISGAMACGVVFLAIKVVEYSAKLAEGIYPTTNDFFLYYFVFTGIHAAHVVLGLAGLVVVRHFVSRPARGPYDERIAEIGASFWHMVDLLWIVLFPLFYLVA